MIFANIPPSALTGGCSVEAFFRRHFLHLSNNILNLLAASACKSSGEVKVTKVKIWKSFSTDVWARAVVCFKVCRFFCPHTRPLYVCKLLQQQDIIISLYVIFIYIYTLYYWQYLDREIWRMYNIASARTSWTAYFTRPLLYTSVWSWHVLGPFVPVSHCLFSKSKSSAQTGWDLLVASPPELWFRKYIKMENAHVSP